MSCPVPLVDFDNGKLISASDDTPVQLFQNKNKNDDRFLSVKIGDNEYIGQNKRRKVDEPCKLYIAVRKGDSVSFHEAEKFSLHRFDGDNRVFEENTPVMSFRQKTDQLTSAYGSSKKQRAMRSRQLNKIEGEALDSAMDVSIDVTPQIPVEGQSEKEDASIEYLPPYNKEASRPEDVYNLKDIISPTEFEAMKTTALTLVNATIDQVNEWRNEGKYGYFVIHHIPVLQDLQEEKQLDVAVKLQYLHCMLKLYHMHYGDIRKSRVPFPEGTPSSVCSHLLNEFTEVTFQGNGRKIRSRSRKAKDKLLIHILILAMMIDDYRLQIQELMIDLKMNRAAMVNYLRNIGAQLKKSSVSVFKDQKLDTYTAEISIPLSFPSVRKGKSKK